MDHGTTVDNMTRLVLGIFVLVCQIGLSMQACAECACCKGSFTCESNKNCVDGCIDGYYGYKCTDKCLENCKTCVNGSGCTECKPGYYTDNCSIPCGKGCVNNTCLISSGDCPCKSFYFTGSKCDACIGLTYGEDCNNTCPSNCRSCISDTECKWCKQLSVYYGSYCQYRCSVGCIGRRCDKGNGHCTGCKPGFNGDKCDTCSPGFYGRYCDLNCTENCRACLSATNCTRCQSGFYGETCTNVCPFGCYSNCSFADGRCLECKPGLFGEYCEKQCSDTCINKSCNWKTGHCLEECGMDFYGLFCNNSCSTTCLPHFGKRSCHGIKGQCLFGCKDGFHGERCNNICSSLCVNTTCNQTTAECLYGCIDGFKGPKCTEAVIPDREAFYTRSTLIGSTMGTFLAGGIVVGIALLISFIVWRRRNILTKKLDVHGYENTIGPCGNRSNDDTHESNSPVTYEDLKSRDERLYTQISTSQQISPPATDYVN